MAENPIAGMTLEEIRAHWEQWAQAGTNLRATTKTPTIKRLEIDAFARALQRAGLSYTSEFRVLEAGCGNGHNLIPLAQQFSRATFHGFDYIPKMVANARLLADQAGVGERVRFVEGSIIEFDTISGLDVAYDVVLTDRLLINLNTEEDQLDAMAALSRRVRPGGFLFILENFEESYGQQNDARTWLGLPRRTPDKFNRFIRAGAMIHRCEQLGLEYSGVDNFAGLHDLLLYVLVPAINGGAVDYQHPIVEASVEFSRRASAEYPDFLRGFGQNQLHQFRKPDREA